MRWAAAMCWLLLASAASAFDWAAYAAPDVVNVVTQDAGGAERDTPVWIVVVQDAGYLRTNDSRWLANIRSGSAVAVRSGEQTQSVTATEVSDPVVKASVEEAFKAKYGLTQRIMSAFRMREPSVLLLEARPAP